MSYSLGKCDYALAGCRVGLLVAICPKLCHSLNLISGSRWPKAVAKSCGGHIQSIPHVIQAVANLSSCGGHIQSIPHVIQAVANLSSYSLGSQSASILYGDSSPQLLLDSGIKWGTVLGIWQPLSHRTRRPARYRYYSTRKYLGSWDGPECGITEQRCGPAREVVGGASSGRSLPRPLV